MTLSLVVWEERSDGTQVPRFVATEGILEKEASTNMFKKMMEYRRPMSIFRKSGGRANQSITVHAFACV